MAEIEQKKGCCGPGYATPQDAMKGERETILYTIGLYTGTGVEQPDFLATIDVDESSPTHGQIIHRLPMPNLNDELHHFGWNACSSCHGDAGKARRFLIIPGLQSGNIYVVDTIDQRAPVLVKTIAGEEIKQRENLSAPHTVHCLANGKIMISMLGDANGARHGGFLLLNEQFEVEGKWEADPAQFPDFNYDFWYQPKHNVMVSSEWGEPLKFYKGFDLNDVANGNYGRRLHFWNWNNRTIERSVDLGSDGLIPLEVRFHHNPASTHGFVAAALSSNIFHWYKEKEDGDWKMEKVIDVAPVSLPSWDFPVPSLITDLVLSLDDRWLYFSNWLHGDLRQYDISDPSHPVLTGQLWLGGLAGINPAFSGSVNGHKVSGGPQMIQLSLDGKRLYVTNSLFSSWDNQFFPSFSQLGSYLLQVDCDTENGGLRLNDNFFVDFGAEPLGPARAHEMRYPGGDCTSDIWL